jgi:hypothetical protein
LKKMTFDAREAHYVLNALMARRKVALRHVREILKDREKEIAALRHRLGELENIGARATARAAGEAKVTIRRAKRRLSPKLRALRRQQGRYMGLLRRMTVAEKARIRAVREKKGLPAAIRAALSAGRS